MSLDWLDVAHDGHDALHWSYFVEPDTFELDSAYVSLDVGLSAPSLRFGGVIDLTDFVAP
jgi:hypothetical protein